MLNGGIGDDSIVGGGSRFGTNTDSLTGGGGDDTFVARFDSVFDAWWGGIYGDNLVITRP